MENEFLNWIDVKLLLLIIVILGPQCSEIALGSVLRNADSGVIIWSATQVKCMEGKHPTSCTIF